MLVKPAAAAAEPADVSAAVCRCLVKEDSISVIRTLGIGEFGVVQQAIWTKDSAHQVPVLAHLVVLCVCVRLCV